MMRSELRSGEEVWRVSEKEMEFLNDYIVARKVPKDPDLSFISDFPLTDKAKAFIEDIVKSNPAVRLPWRD